MEPVNKNASKEARELLQYISEISGKGIITGQHTQTRAMEEMDVIKKVTGKLPALCGFELLAYSPNINYESGDLECQKEIDENKGTLEQAMDWALNKKGILTFTWHWFSPIGGYDKSFYTEKTEIDATKILLEGTEERKAFFHDLDSMAKNLKKFQDKNIPILWRPFHEAEGEWFWWGAKGPNTAKGLYRLMYEHYVNHHQLNNLIWVWNSPLVEGYPGDDVVDIITRDLYEPKGTKTDYANKYKELVQVSTADKPFALGEIGLLPDMSMLEESKIPWCYYMTWSKGFVLDEEYNSFEALKNVYKSNYAITLDKLPK